jgi:hypothetical protein
VFLHPLGYGTFKPARGSKLEMVQDLAVNDRRQENLWEKRPYEIPDPFFLNQDKEDIRRKR